MSKNGKYVCYLNIAFLISYTDSPKAACVILHGHTVTKEKKSAIKIFLYIISRRLLIFQVVQLKERKSIGMREPNSQNTIKQLTTLTELR